MLRGVNKTIIEVVETDNQYFERAILFVRQSQRGTAGDLLQGKAAEYLSNMQPGAAAQGTAVQTKTRPLLSHTWVKVGLGLALAVVVGLLLL